MALVDTDLWREFVADPPGRAHLRDQLVKALSSDDIGGLLDLCETGSNHEKNAAIRVLMVPARWKDARMGPDSRRRFAELLRSISRKEYPNPPLGPLSLQAWMDVDAKSVEDFLVNELDWQPLQPRQLKWVVINLRSLGTAPALSLLHQIAETAGGDVAEEAQRALTASGLASRAAIEAAGKEWRETRSGQALSRLYELRLRHLPEGTPMSEIHELLGPPTRRSGSGLWYETQGAALYVEQDTRGRLGGMKLN